MAVTRLRFNERTTARVIGTLLDRDGDLVPGSDLISADLTLYDIDTYEPLGSPTGGIINSREVQDVLGVGSPGLLNGVTIHDTLQTDADGSTYSFEWTLDPADNIIVTPRRQIERHKATFHFVWIGGEIYSEFEIDVVNMRSVA